MLMLRQFLNSFHPIEDAVMDQYLSLWKEHTVPRKTVMTAEGDVERYLYFTLEGVQRSYLLHDGKEHVIAFSYAPSFSGIPNSFITQKPSRYYLETITKSRFLRIPHDVHSDLLSKQPELGTLFRKATELVLVGVIDRHAELMAHDIETRFRDFVARSPHLLNLVPHKDLAAYLRMDATNFSRLLGSVKL